MSKDSIVKYFNSIAKDRDKWKKKNRYYYRELENLLKFFIPNRDSILEVGCGTGDFLNALKPKEGVGIDISREMIDLSKKKYPEYEFYVMDAEDMAIKRKFDYVIMSDLLGHLEDVWQAFRQLDSVIKPETRIIVTYYNFLWEPILRLAERLNLKMRQKVQNWLSLADIENLLNLNGYEVIKKGRRFLLPIYIPLISELVNRYLAKIPILEKMCLLQYLIARKSQSGAPVKDYSCSIIVPCRNEAGNIENIVRRISNIGKSTEIIFVDGESSDNTVQKIEEMISSNKGIKDIKLIPQKPATGKADAVRKGFRAANGEILMILDADITVQPEDLTKFYLALAEGKAEFANGTRLVYPLEKDSMRILNIFGNKAFSILLSYILGQRVKDTLCGTKVLFKKDYDKIVQHRDFFGGRLDPFGDFELLFGAAKLNLKILEVPVRYKERVYGYTKIRRFKHGLILLKMSMIALKRFKFNN